jgi:hypothetical protein
VALAAEVTTWMQGGLLVSKAVPRQRRHHIKEVVLPKHLCGIESKAFSGCWRLAEVKAEGARVLAAQGPSACALHILIRLLEIKLPRDSVDEIKSIVRPLQSYSLDGGAFQDCPMLRSVEIPLRITSIADGAFCGLAQLERILLPNAAISIGRRVFDGRSGLLSVVIPDSVT